MQIIFETISMLITVSAFAVIVAFIWAKLTERVVDFLEDSKNIEEDNENN